MKTALVIGATGLTGKHLVKLLLESDDYQSVVIFTRRKLDLDHPKLLTHIVDFDKMQEWGDLISGDDVFSAMGTTIKQAGSKQAFYKVDYTYPANFIEQAMTNGASRLFLISAPGINTKSPVFYNRVKAQLEEYLSSLNYATSVYFRPSIIYGDREHSRLGEQLGERLLGFSSRWIPGMKKYQPISGQELARAIVNCACSDLPKGQHIYEWAEIFKL